MENKEQKSGIEKLREDTLTAFKEYQQKQGKFYKSLELWLWSMPLLQYENNQKEIITEIVQTVEKHIANCQVENIANTVCQITKNKLAKMRDYKKAVYDPQLLDKLAIKSPSSHSLEIDTTLPGLKKLSPISRLLISLSKNGVSKKEMASMLFVGPSQITNYFKKLEKEIKEL